MLIDTGFDGALVLPLSVIQRCRFPHVSTAEYTMANGTLTTAEVFRATIKWLDKTKTILVVAGNDDTSLLGMELLKHAKTTLIPNQNILMIEGA